MENTDTSIVGDAKPVNTTKREPEIEERPLREQEEAQKSQNLEKSDGDATGTNLEEQTGENMERRRKASYLDDEKTDSIPERRSSGDDEQKEKAHRRRKGLRRNSESGKEASNKEKGPHHENESREKTTQMILRRRKGRDNANTDYEFPLSIGLKDHTPCL